MNCRRCGSQLGTWQLICSNCGTHAPENTPDANADRIMESGHNLDANPDRIAGTVHDPDADPERTTGNGNDPVALLNSLAWHHLAPRLKQLAQEVMDPRARAQAVTRRQQDAWRRQLEQQKRVQQEARKESPWARGLYVPRRMTLPSNTVRQKVHAYACAFWAHADQHDSSDFRWEYDKETRAFRALLEQERAVWELRAQGDSLLEAHMAEDRRYWEKRDEWRAQQMKASRDT
jgi:hypothetical protein